MRKGFSILEVVLTLAFLGLAILPLTSVLKKAESIAHYAANKKTAITLASSLLETETFYDNSQETLTIPDRFILKKEATVLPAGIKNVTINIFWQTDSNKNAAIALHRRYYEGVD